MLEIRFVDETRRGWESFFDSGPLNGRFFDVVTPSRVVGNQVELVSGWEVFGSFLEIEIGKKNKGVAVEVFGEFFDGEDVALIEGVVGEKAGFGDVEEEGFGGGVVEGIEEAGFAATESFLNLGGCEVVVIPDGHFIEFVDVGDCDRFWVDEVEEEIVRPGTTAPAVGVWEIDPVKVGGVVVEVLADEVSSGCSVDEHEGEGGREAAKTHFFEEVVGIASSSEGEDLPDGNHVMSLAKGWKGSNERRV